MGAATAAAASPCDPDRSSRRRPAAPARMGSVRRPLPIRRPPPPSGAEPDHSMDRYSDGGFFDSNDDSYGDGHSYDNMDATRNFMTQPLPTTGGYQGYQHGSPGSSSFVSPGSSMAALDLNSQGTEWAPMGGYQVLLRLGLQGGDLDNANTSPPIGAHSTSRDVGATTVGFRAPRTNGVGAGSGRATSMVSADGHGTSIPTVGRSATQRSLHGPRQKATSGVAEGSMTCGRRSRVAAIAEDNFDGDDVQLLTNAPTLVLDTAMDVSSSSKSSRSSSSSSSSSSDSSDDEVISMLVGDDSSHLSIGKFYLVDSGYLNRPGYFAPFKGTKYHLREFHDGLEPEGKNEIFNFTHSSLRNVIERCFGVLKMKWRILLGIPSYPIDMQKKIIVACMALHNFIRASGLVDRDFSLCDRDENYIPPEA